MSTLKCLWDEDTQYHPTTSESDKTKLEEDKIFKVVADLWKDCEGLGSRVLMTKPLSCYNDVCHAIQSEEAQRKLRKLLRLVAN